MVYWAKQAFEYAMNAKIKLKSIILGTLVFLVVSFVSCRDKSEPGESNQSTPVKTPIVTAPTPPQTVPAYEQYGKKGIRPRKAKFYRKWE